MKKKKRLHSDDARLLRDMFYDLMARIVSIEEALGDLQSRVIPQSPTADCEIPEEVIYANGK